MIMQHTGLLVYVSLADARAVIEQNYPGSKEINSDGEEDILLEHKSNGKADRRFQIWEYTHPKQDSLWIVNDMPVEHLD